MADAMTEIRGDIFTSSVYFCGSSWSVYLLLLCVCVLFFASRHFVYIYSLQTFGILCLSSNDRFRGIKSEIIKYC